MLCTALSIKFLWVLSWEMGSETKLDFVILEGCTKALLGEGGEKKELLFVLPSVDSWKT